MSVSKFQTLVEVPKYRWQTGYSQKIIFMGSCFTENIGSRMETLKYDVDINPFGILYNPFSVSNGLRILLQQKEFKSEDLIFADGLWHSFSHHGRFSSADENDALEQINSRIKSSADFLKNAGFLFITFGTAWIYKFKKTGQTVSNCHKIPAKEFERVRLNVDEIVDEYRDLLTEIRKVNTSLKVVFTVSPIRHWKDGAIENQRSKAVLLLSIDKLNNEFGDDFCAYFPAYEIVMDELRDYRFYAEDMIHISDVAVEHIWEKFQSALIDKESQQIAAHVQKIVKAASHRPIHKNTTEYNQFLLQMNKQIEDLETKYKNLNFTAEKVYFKTEKTGQTKQ
jgi:predicted nucleic acid-binding Zn finger protein